MFLERFQMTKNVSEGFLMQHFQGSVTVSAANSGSSTATILLPALVEKGSRRPPADDTRSLGPMLLVLASRLSERDVTARTLEQAGYNVLEAGGVDDASAILEACQVDVVVAFGAQGEVLASRQPDLPIIAAQGLSGEALLASVRKQVAARYGKG